MHLKDKYIIKVPSAGYFINEKYDKESERDVLRFDVASEKYAKIFNYDVAKKFCEKKGWPLSYIKKI